MRTRRRLGHRVLHDIDELTHAASDPAAARELARLVMRDLDGDHSPTAREVVAAVVARCADDGQRSGLAAYLHLCRDVSFDSLANLFDVTPPAARRLVERGTGTAPVTAADECRGWALVAPRPGRTDPEVRAASGHLSLCRRCRYRLRAHAVLEQRVAAAGSTAFGASVTAAVGRAFAGSHVASAAGAITGPVLALSTAAALTAGAGAFAVTTRDGGSQLPRVSNVSHDGPAPHGGGRAPARSSRPASSDANPTATSVPATAPTPLPDAAPSRLAPLPGTTLLKLPTLSTSPLPLPTVSISPLPLTTTSPLPVPVPTLTLPPLP
ncbi:MAG TPA: hypothetical protein VFH66_14900 [Mycobacteriales bacterium]|nr:hypothetical protein [Mycobacteriales bacterium]